MRRGGREYLLENGFFVALDGGKDMVLKDSCSQCEHYRNKVCWNSDSGWYLGERQNESYCHSGFKAKEAE
jgi:hypothetical protein